MANKELAIGQVGACGFAPLIGIDAALEQDIIAPRVIIIEPVPNSYQFENRISAALFEERGQYVVTADFYKNDDGVEIGRTVPRLGLLFLENVLNDPNYSKDKDVSGMLSFTNRTVVPGGLVLVTDLVSVFHSLNPGMLIYKEVVRLAPDFGFTVILDELSTPPPNLLTMEQKKTLLVGLAEKLNILDPALRDGIEKKCNHKYADWLILQKNAHEADSA